ncbi:MAG TPA: hypothetical protein VKR61_17825 [Bryobacteraceae bacterium]|nr:hypothetical protein [Bryobacteraceae bacterium]
MIADQLPAPSRVPRMQAIWRHTWEVDKAFILKRREVPLAIREAGFVGEAHGQLVRAGTATLLEADPERDLSVGEEEARAGDAGKPWRGRKLRSEFDPAVPCQYPLALILSEIKERRIVENSGRRSPPS